MIETAENLRAQYGIGRAEQDELAAQSHARAVAAQDSGVFAAEIVPITVPGRKGDTVVETDEHPRRGVTAESLAGLRPIYAKTTEGATVTAGNASGQNDGAAVCVVTTRAKADEHGLTPLATLKTWAVAGVPASHMGIGPVPAVAKAFARSGLDFDDLDLVELNEAFAAQALACTAEWKYGDLDGPLWARTNVHGSGISLGHPVGATGVRILTTMLRELQRREGRYALETMCIGGGQGLAAIFERA
jgi:acetyl-CoA C-acetyltransferase